MRFFENGPSIPDELLTARDQGRVVLFCGAGVSRAKAELPDFFGLAREVISKLGIPDGSPAHKTLDEISEIETRTGAAGLISVDRIFGFLEGEDGFDVPLIEKEIASALKPDSPDLTAHRTLLDLATSPEGIVRLVTTNFDRLFDDCGRNLSIWKPPRLPNPLRAKEMDGIVYLHGRANQDYTGAEDGGFILSSSQFGRAYLAEGWATSFIREIIQQYVVVFIGYSADDPPVHYLLEALNNLSGSRNIYAFQSGSEEEARSKWFHKGVEAIAYDSADKHRLLWQSLDAWAERARNPEQWYSTVINKAKQGPRNLSAHERGQVAHLVSTIEGARKFAEADEPPPAEWLCVFDPQRRYAPPRHTGPGPYVDPFLLYGLDSDVPREQLAAEKESHSPHTVPWNAFSLNRVDLASLAENNVLSLNGLRTLPENISLPKRLDQLSRWIAKVAHQPAALWWAVRQHAFHPSLIDSILDEILFSNAESRIVWHYLFESWKRRGRREKFNSALYRLEREIQLYGWNKNVLRRYSLYTRLYLIAETNFSNNDILPPRGEEVNLRKLIKLEISYPEETPNVAVPDEWLPAFAAELRKNLEVALALEDEINPFQFKLRKISPIVPDKEADQDSRTRGLSGAVLYFVSIFESLVQADLASAKREFAKWPTDDDTIFARLRIWAASKPELIPNDQFENIVDELSDAAFWDTHHERDLLFTLSARWNALDCDARFKIEKRLLAGRLRRWEWEAEEEFKKWGAWAALNRITWLAKQGCELYLDLETETKRLQENAPEWRPAYADGAIKSFENKTGLVVTDTEHSVLLHEPLSSVLSKSLELSKITHDPFLEKDPYAGLAKERPVRAFAALRLAAKRHDFPEWAWRKFLDIEARKTDKQKFVAFIAEQLARYPNEVLSTFLWSAAYWLLNVSKELAVNYPQSFDRVTNRLIQTLAAEPVSSSPAMVQSGKEPDWITKAINHPAGNVAQSLFNDPRTNGLKAGVGFSPDWLKHVEALLTLHEEPRCHALAIFARQINWFYTINQDWTKKNLLTVLDSDVADEIDALWAGFLRSHQVNQELYLLLKQCFLQFAKSDRVARQGLDGSVAGMLLFGWGILACISDDELRDVLMYDNDKFRSSILWKIKEWASESPRSEEWKQLLPRLLKDVWPRQKKFKTPSISKRLCDVVFFDEKLFPELADVSLPLLTQANGRHLMLFNLRKPERKFIEQHPDKVLAVLHVVLPDDVSYWPYDIEEIFNQIETANKSLNFDERLIELKRRWNSR